MNDLPGRIFQPYRLFHLDTLAVEFAEYVRREFGLADHSEGGVDMGAAHIGERCPEPVFASFKDILTRFRNAGTEPCDAHDGRYRFTIFTISLLSLKSDGGILSLERIVKRAGLFASI